MAVTLAPAKTSTDWFADHDTTVADWLVNIVELLKVAIKVTRPSNNTAIGRSAPRHAAWMQQ